MIKSYKLKVFGKVQGVGFRYYTKLKADALNLMGEVKNESDGSVRIFVQGNEADVKSFIDWCHHGPPSSQVDKLIFEESEIKDIDSFPGIKNNVLSYHVK